jgi:hypothetical protein
MPLRPIPTNNAKDSAGKVMGIDYENVIILIISILLSLGLFYALISQRFTTNQALALSLIPFGLSNAWVFGLRQGRPPGYDLDFLQTHLRPQGWAKPPIEQKPFHPTSPNWGDPGRKIINDAPNGFFINDLLVYGDPPRFVSKGFVFEAPDLLNAPDSFRQQWRERICVFLSQLNENTRAQIQWSVDSNYKEELLAYGNATEALAAAPYAREARDERFTRYWSLMKERKLRRERVVLYLSKRITVAPPLSNAWEVHFSHYSALLAEYESEFRNHAMILENIFTGTGTRIHPMANEDLFAHFSVFLNPSLLDRFDFDCRKLFRPLDTIQDNCLHAAAQSGSKQRPAFGFCHDGYYYNILTLSRCPDHTYENCGLALTNTSMIDYSITVNLYPQSVEKIVKKEQVELDRAKGSYAATQAEEFVTTIGMKKTRIKNLTEGTIKPFQADFIFTLWAKTPTELAEKTAALKTAINALDSAHYHEPTLFATNRKLWFQSWPGWVWGNYSAHARYIESPNLADLLPFSSSPVGNLKEAEAIYDGDNKNLVGYQSFKGGQPQHLVIVGITGGGKSMLLFDQMLQIAPYYHHTLIIEEGLSHKPFTEKMGYKPFVIRPDGRITINYFDTLRLPLSELQKSAATALCSKMAGAAPDEQKQNIQTALIGAYVDRLYSEVAQEWLRWHTEEEFAIARQVCAVERFLKESNDPDLSYSEAWMILRDTAQAEKARELLSRVSESEISLFLKTPTGAARLRNTVYAYLSAEEMPMHAMLVESMKRFVMPEHDARQVKDIAALLQAYTAIKGDHGPLFDGVTNISLTDPVVHFETGRLGDHAEDLKSLTYFLVANFSRNYILSLPRPWRKQAIFEEPARFEGIPGGKRLLKEFYAVMRKFGCRAVTVYQNYDQLRSSSIRAVVLGNASQLLIARQKDITDLQDLSRDIQLPETAQKKILNYPLPAHMPEGKRFASMTYHHLDAIAPVCVTLCNIMPEQMKKDYDLLNNQQPQPKNP